MKLKYNKKGVAAFNTLKSGALSMGIAFITAGVVVTVLSSLSTSLTGEAAAAVANGTAGIATLTSYGTIFGTILAVVVLMLLVSMIKFGGKN